MTKKEIEQFLIKKRGYIKKGNLIIAKRLWQEFGLPKDSQEAQKDLRFISEIKPTIRVATIIEEDVVENELEQLYQSLVEEKNKPKRILFYDLETSPNITFSWRIGYKINLSHENILQERAIICVSYKWNDEDEIHNISWDRGDDYKLVKKFAEIMNSADIVIGQNSDKYDEKFLRTRAIYHGIPLKVKFDALDTLKMARSKFSFNSNKLDYLSTFLGFQGKTDTSYSLWKDIVLHNDETAMNKMVEYCNNDILVLEQVYNELKEYVPKKRFETAFI